MGVPIVALGLLLVVGGLTGNFASMLAALLDPSVLIGSTTGTTGNQTMSTSGSGNIFTASSQTVISPQAVA